MEFKFVPLNLINAKNEIVSMHKETGEPLKKDIDPDGIRMIKKLSSMSRKEAKEEALVLRKDYLEIIARYLPHNYYNVRMENLFLIFQLRCNLKLCWLLFYEWQNAYYNQECNEFLKSFVIRTKYFNVIMDSCHMSVSEFEILLSAPNISVAYGKKALALKEMDQTLKEKLQYLGIKHSSLLFKKCEFLFYTFCTVTEYLSIEESKLLEIIKKYNDFERKIFLKNFLTEMTLSQLKKYVYIAKFFVRLTGENKSNEFHEYFSVFDVLIIKKYVDWINIYKINEIFGNDERSCFWENYHLESVKKYSYSNSVVMEFEDFIAIEFLGQDMGPAYIYKRDYFEQKVKERFNNRRIDNTELRSYLYRYTKYVSSGQLIGMHEGIRLVHRPNPGWQTNFHFVLIYNDITKKIL